MPLARCHPERSEGSQLIRTFLPECELSCLLCGSVNLEGLL